MNVSSDEFAEALVLAGWPDPRKSAFALPEGTALSTAWSGFKVYRDLDVPQALRPSEVVAVVGRSASGGAPVFVARLNLKDFLSRDAKRSIAVVEGGMVGLHDFKSGKGHVEPPDGAILMDDMLSWRVPAKGVSIAAAHEVSDDFFDVVVEDAVRRSDWMRIDDHKWRRPGPDGGAVEIGMSLSDVREQEFWVQTLDRDGLQFGPQETPEVWPDLESAKESGDHLATIEWGAPAFAP